MFWEGTENIFDFLYQFILFVDFISNDIPIDREYYVNRFIYMMNDVYERQRKSHYFDEFHNASSIQSFYKTILRPRLRG
jgi:ABC-type microcin C transport system permease subunit YejE